MTIADRAAPVEGNEHVGPRHCRRQRLRSGNVSWDDFWKLLLGGAITVVGGLLLHQVQLGGRKRRRRRDIKEQLELLVLLDQHPDVKTRIERRVEAALERYEPSPETRRAAQERWTGPVSIAIAILVVIPGIVLSDISFSDPLLLVAISISAATGALGIEELLSRRLQERAENSAVARGSGQGTWGFKGRGHGVRPPDPPQTVVNPPSSHPD